MLWPVVFPLKITLWLLAGFVFVATVTAPVCKWRVEKAFLVSSFLAIIAFVPLCSGIGTYVNAGRFGVFEYESFDEIQDPRVEWYLPPTARKIVVDKQAMGHRAKYEVELDDLLSFLDDEWAASQGSSAITREELDDGQETVMSYFELRFDALDWKLPESAMRFHSPVASDGAGAIYYFDESSGMAFHHAGYW
ncbi:MAG: hypothetical protein AAF664_01590 [Planctomycetota bacterium]